MALINSQKFRGGFAEDPAEIFAKYLAWVTRRVTLSTTVFQQLAVVPGPVECIYDSPDYYSLWWQA